MKTNHLAVIAAVGAAFSASANQSLDDLTVTASAQAIQTNQFGGTLTVITSEQIEAAQALMLSDVLRQVPGFAVSQSGGIGSQTQIRVRGAESNHLLVMVDGVRINDPAIGDDFLASYGLTDNIDRIEIIRGPQSALWGTDALAGVINIITKQGEKNQWGAEFEYGSFNSASLGINGTWTTDQSRWHAGIRSTDSAGSNISRSGQEEDGFENTQLQLGGDFQASDAWQITFKANHSEGMNEYDNTDFTTSLPADSDDWTEVKQSTALLNAAYQPKGGAWHSAFGISHRASDNDNFTLGDVSTGSTESDTQAIHWNNSFFFGKGQKHRFSVLMDHQDVDFAQTGIASSFGDPNQKQNYAVLGTAAELAIEASDHWFVQLSARQDDYNRFDDVSTFNVATSYAINDDFRIRATAGTGSKAPTFIERFGYTPDSFVGNPDLKPEESDAWEIGFDYSLTGGTLSLVYFDQNLDNEINGFAFDPSQGAFTAINKDGASERSGVELSWFKQLNNQLRIDANYTYTDATERDAEGNQITEIRRPENMANVTVNYAFAQQRGQLYAQLRYQGKQYDNFFDPMTFAAVATELDAATTVDLTFTWAWRDDLDFYLKGHNVFDEDQEEVLGYARPGAAYYIGIKSQF